MYNKMHNMKVDPLIRQCRLAFGIRMGMCAGVGMVTLLGCDLATAADWGIDPVRVELSQEHKTASVTVKNDSDQPTTMQIQAVAWSQVDGKDVFQPSKDLLVSPPIVTIAPKSEQLIRVALRREAEANKELTYRINLLEVPSTLANDFMGVQVALAVGLPVFVQSLKGNAIPNLSWNASRLKDGEIKVVAKNQGNGHIQISDFSLSASDTGKVIADQSGTTYVLAGQTHEWKLKTNSLNSVVDQLHLKGYTDAENIDTGIALARP